MKQRADGRWRKSKVINGKLMYFYSLEPTEKRAEKDIERQIIKAFTIPTEEERKKKFSAVAEEWEAVKREELPEATWAKAYKAAYTRVKEYFESFFIDDIQPKDIDLFMSGLKRLKYSLKNVQTHKCVLNMIFNYAFLNNYVKSNFIPYIKLPSGLTKKPRKMPSDEEMKVATTNYEGEDFLFYFLAYTGLRISEACALTDKDFDLKSNRININKKIVWLGNRPNVVNQPKTSAGARNVPLLNAVAEKMPKFKGYLFSRDGGKTPLTKSQLAHMIERYQKRHNVSATPHQLRHAFATFAVEAELNIKETQYILGHSDIHTTMNIYAEITDKKQAELSEKLNKHKY